MEPQGHAWHPQDGGVAPGSASDPLVVQRLSEQFLSFAEKSQLSTREGQELLGKIEKLPFPFQRATIVNSTLPHGIPGRGVLSIHNERLTKDLVSRLVSLGLNLGRTLPIETPDMRKTGRVLYGGNIYHRAALDCNVALLRALPQDPTLANARNSYGETPVVTAIKYGTVAALLPEVIDILVSCGANLEERDETGRHSFHYCMRFPGTRVLLSVLDAWNRLGKAPLNRFDIESAIALSLFDASWQGQSTTKVLSSLLEKAGASKSNEPKVLVDGLVESFVMLLPRDARLGQGGSATHGLHATPLNAALRRLSSHAGLLSDDFTSHLTAMPLPGIDRPLLAAAYLRGVDAETLRLIVRFGADPFVPFESVGLSTMKINRGTILHHAFNEGRLEVATMILAEVPGLGSALDENGNTPLHIYLLSLERQQRLSFRNRVDPMIMERGLVAGYPPDFTNNEGVSLTDLALRLGSLDALEVLARHGASAPARDVGSGIETRTPTGNVRRVGYLELIRAAKAWRGEIGKFDAELIKQKVFDDGLKVLRHGRSVYVSYLYYMAASEMLLQKTPAGEDPSAGDALLKLSPQILFHQPQGYVDGLWHAIEWMSDHYPKPREEQRHPNEAEMMLLLNHPRHPNLDPRALNPLTRALTSITRIYDLGRRTVEYPFVWNLARIGLYTHGFHLSVKVDTETPMRYVPGEGWKKSGVSLLEKRLDLVKVPRRSTDSEFGPGFLLLASEADLPKARLARRSQKRGDGQGELWKMEPYSHQEYSLSPDTMMEFRRGYIMVSNPVHGTLIIRNSSKIFGRNVLKHPAYWTPKGYRKEFSYNELLNITREQIESTMGHVLAPGVALNSLNTDPIYALLRQLDVIRDKNRRLKFETSSREAFVRDATSGKIALSEHGGYRSPGFRGIVEFLRERLDGIKMEIEEKGRATKELPDLAFVMPFFPPWITYRFSTDHGEVHSRLAINEDVLQVLEGLVTGSFTSKLQALDGQYGVSKFLQEAGFDMGGELVLLSAKDV